MTKQEIDKSFISLIPMLINIVNGVKWKNRRTITTDAAINEAYIYIQKLNFEDEDTLQRVIINFLSQNIKWTNSQLNKKENLSRHNDLVGHFEYDYEDNGTNGVGYVYSTSEDELLLVNKIEIEKWYDEKNCILEMYYNSVTDKVKKIVFECYFHKGITKCVDMGKHFGINKDYASKYIREMKADINEFHQNYLENNNK